MLSGAVFMRLCKRRCISNVGSARFGAASAAKFYKSQPYTFHKSKPRNLCNLHKSRKSHRIRAAGIIWLGSMERRAADRSCAVFPTLGLYALFIWMFEPAAPVYGFPKWMFICGRLTNEKIFDIILKKDSQAAAWELDASGSIVYTLLICMD